MLKVEPKLLSIQTKIRRHFGWSLENDLIHAEHLVQSTNSQFTTFNPNSTLTALGSRLVHHPGKIGIVGAAAEPNQIISAVSAGALLIVADGAFGAILAAPPSTHPNLFAAAAALVSDGDGGSDVIDAAIRAGLPIILHAHGDNTVEAAHVIDQISKIGIDEYPLAITHACPGPIQGAHNPGGFTDGDRAACLVISLGITPERLMLIGHRSDIVGRWTGPTDPIRKLQKLEWMVKIFEMLGVTMDTTEPEREGRD